MDDHRAQRLAQNESLFRGINDRLGEGHARFGLEDAQEFVCECASIACTERVRLSPQEYERVRSNPLRHLIAPGHDVPGIEEVVERHHSHHVVEKIGPGSEVAEREDPRARANS